MDILDLPVDSDSTNAETVRDYLKELLITLWTEGEGFSGKRPFGNSGWEFDLYSPLVEAGMVEGTLDEDGYLEDCDSKKADYLIIQAIKALN